MSSFADEMSLACDARLSQEGSKFVAVDRQHILSASLTAAKSWRKKNCLYYTGMYANKQDISLASCHIHEAWL